MAGACLDNRAQRELVAPGAVGGHLRQVRGPLGVIANKEELATKILFFLNRGNEKKSYELIGNAQKFIANQGETLDNYLKEIKKFL